MLSLCNLSTKFFDEITKKILFPWSFPVQIAMMQSTIFPQHDFLLCTFVGFFVKILCTYMYKPNIYRSCFSII